MRLIPRSLIASFAALAAFIATAAAEPRSSALPTCTR